MVGVKYVAGKAITENAFTHLSGAPLAYWDC